MSQPEHVSSQKPGSGPTAGKAFGDYTLLERLSDSKTGTVWKAQHRMTGRTVAVKMLSQAAMTIQGQAMGTGDYMAPEQTLDARSVDARADIYSLGCTLCMLLTGRPPYRAASWVALVGAHLTAPIPSLSATRRDVPQALDAVFQKMLAKRPEDRYASMEEVIAALRESVATGAAGAAGASAWPDLQGTDLPTVAWPNPQAPAAPSGPSPGLAMPGLSGAPQPDLSDIPWPGPAGPAMPGAPPPHLSNVPLPNPQGPLMPAVLAPGFQSPAAPPASPPVSPPHLQSPITEGVAWPDMPAVAWPEPQEPVMPSVLSPDFPTPAGPAGPFDATPFRTAAPKRRTPRWVLGLVAYGSSALLGIALAYFVVKLLLAGSHQP